MATRLFGALSQVKAVEYVKGHFFFRANEKLSQLVRLETNELVLVDLRAMAAALSRPHAETMEPIQILSVTLASVDATSVGDRGQD